MSIRMTTFILNETQILSFITLFGSDYHRIAIECALCIICSKLEHSSQQKTHCRDNAHVHQIVIIFIFNVFFFILLNDTIYCAATLISSNNLCNGAGYTFRYVTIQWRMLCSSLYCVQCRMYINKNQTKKKNPNKID